MFQHSSSRNGRSKGSKVKRVLQVAVLLAIVVWLLHRINNKEEHGGSYESSYSKEEDVDFGRKGKAGSENVIVIDRQKESADGASETDEAGDNSDMFSKITENGASEINEAGDKSDVFSEQIEENKVEVAKESSEVRWNNDQTEVEQQELENKGEVTDSNTQNGEAATGDETSETKDVIELPSERESDNSADRNEESNSENNSANGITDDRNEENNAETNSADGKTNDSVESINSDERIISESNNQPEVLENNSVEKEATDQPGQGGNNEIKIQSDEHVEQQPPNTEGTSDISTNSDAHETDEHVEQSLNTEGANGASTDDHVTYGDLSNDSGTTDHQVVETENSVNHSTSTEQNGVLTSTNGEASKDSELEFQNAHIKLENASTEVTSMESHDEFDKPLGGNNEELSTINETLERDAVQQHENSASNLEVTSNSQGENGNVNPDSNTEGSTLTEEIASDAGNNGDSTVYTETNSADDSANPSHDNEQNKSEVTTNANPETNAVETEKNYTSEGENTNNVASEETKSEQTSNEATGTAQENNTVMPASDENSGTATE